MDYARYLDLVVQLIQNHKRPDAPLTAAALGGLLLKAEPEVGFKTFGKRTLREVLDDLEARGRVSLSLTEKGALAVEAVGATPVVAKQAETYNPLHRAMWEAFTFAAPQGKRFINRTTGLIRAGLAVAPNPADEWVEIAPLGAELQRQWASEFLSEQSPQLAQSLETSFNDDGWTPHAFVSELRARDMGVARSWNAFRSRRVSAHVQNWLRDNALPPAWAFQQQSSFGSVTSPIIPVVTATAGDGEARQIIMTALAQMPLAQLLEIPIPVGLVLSAVNSLKR